MSRLSGGSAVGSPGDPPARRRLPEWLREKLFQRRIVLLTGQLDELVASETAAALMSLDAIGDQAIDLHVDSPDGALEAAFVVIDTLDGLRATARVHCRGEVGGTVIGIVAAGDRRSAAPHTRFRLGQPTARFSGTPEEIGAQSRQQQALLWRLYARVGHVTGRPAEEIAEDMRRGRRLDAREALDYGLIEEITTAH
jgi:ATP-dependent Clp protease, protease subunit